MREEFARAHIIDMVGRKDGIKKLQLCEYMARKSHMSTDKMTETSWEKFISSVVMKHGDWSVMRHAVVSVEAVVDLGVAAEWRTHKTGHYDGDDVDVWDECDDIHHGFTQSSTRFVNFTKDTPFIAICPTSIRNSSDDYGAWKATMGSLEQSYNDIIAKGYAPQIARCILPRCTAAQLGVTYTLHQWRYFFLMRTTLQTHPQFREVTMPLLAEFKEFIPLIFDDILPERSQTQNIREPW